MRAPDEFQLEMREIRLRKFRRMFDPTLALVDGECDEPPRRFYMHKVRPVIANEFAGNQGKRPFSISPKWSLPSPSGRGRPIGRDHQRIPHTRNRVGGHQSDQGLPQAVVVDRYNARQERQATIAAAQAAAIDVDATEVSAIGDDRYLNRLEREAIAGGMPSGLRTNMHRDPEEREREWIARTRHERKAGKPRINIKSERNPNLCAAIAADPCWPDALRIAIETDLARHLRGKARPKSKKAGEPWIADNAEEVLGAICAAYTIDPLTADAALSLGRPRAGRVMYKWDGELPRELDEAGRQAYLDDMAASLEDYGIIFVLVMHRPDPVNHPDNYHAHGLYSDRPVTRLEDGSFDIERVIAQDYGRGRRANVHERQNKLRLVSERAWTGTLRRVHVDACNRQLEIAGARGRYNAGGFADIGLTDETPQRKLGSSAARFEAAGVATDIGVTNALIDWERVDTRRRRKHERRMARLAAVRATLEAREALDAAALSAWYLAAQRAEFARVAAEEIEDTIAMALSRSTTTARKSAAIASTYPAGSYERHRWGARTDEARTAIAETERDLLPERTLLSRAHQAAATHASERKRLRNTLRPGHDLAAVAQRRHDTRGLVKLQDAPQPRDAYRFIDQVERRGIAVECRQGRFGYPAGLLQAEGISQAQFAPAPVQSRLAALHARQQREIASVVKLAAGAFVLDARSNTPYVRVVIERWRDHPDVLAAVPRLLTPSSLSSDAERMVPEPELGSIRSGTNKRRLKDDRDVDAPSATAGGSGSPQTKQGLAAAVAAKLADRSR